MLRPSLFGPLTSYDRPSPAGDTPVLAAYIGFLEPLMGPAIAGHLLPASFIVYLIDWPLSAVTIAAAPAGPPGKRGSLGWSFAAESCIIGPLEIDGTSPGALGAVEPGGRTAPGAEDERP